MDSQRPGNQGVRTLGIYARENPTTWGVSASEIRDAVMGFTDHIANVSGCRIPIALCLRN